MTRAKAYLFGGVEIRWQCDPSHIGTAESVPEEATFHFENGLEDYLKEMLDGATLVHPDIFAGKSEKKGGHGSVEWAVAFVADIDPLLSSYCNTIPTPDGGTHEVRGSRSALAKGIKDHAERTNQGKRAASVTSDDVMGSSACMVSVFIREPEFQGQTKDRLANSEATRIVENAIKDPFDHWLAANPAQANKLLEFVVERADERLRRKQEKEISRKSAVKNCACPAARRLHADRRRRRRTLHRRRRQRRRLRQAGARPRHASNIAVARKNPQRRLRRPRRLAQNQQLSDLIQALGCGTGAHFREQDLRYGRVIVMTDADVDGAHIASLLITFFYRQMPKLIDNGHLYLAVPPLYRLSHGGNGFYARDDKHKAEILKKEFHANAKVEIGRFKGLGEMMAAQLKETTMDPKKRTLLRVKVVEDDRKATDKSVERLMGNKPEARFDFIQEKAEFASEELLDV